MVKWRLYIFFWPIDADRTAVVSFVYGKSRYPGPTGGLRLAKWLFRKEIDREIRQDISMLEHMAVKDVNIEGMKLRSTRCSASPASGSTASTAWNTPTENGRVPLVV